jgi:hypothetical protein
VEVMPDKEITVEKYNYILADGQRAITPEGRRLSWDTSVPMTLDRAKSLLAEVRKKMQNDAIEEVRFMDSAFTKSPENELGDWAEATLWQREWRYSAATGELREYKNRDIVSVTDGEGVCDDYVALKDSGY